MRSDDWNVPAVMYLLELGDVLLFLHQALSPPLNRHSRYY